MMGGRRETELQSAISRRPEQEDRPLDQVTNLLKQSASTHR
jgi:hypothetical protein